MIETARLLLRPMRMEDVDDLLHIFADPKVMASFGGLLLDRSQMEQWVLRNLRHQDQYGYGLFSVIHKADRLLVGDCGLERVDVEGTLATELGYDFRSDYWQQGIATEAAVAVRDYAFHTLKLPRLISLIRQGNLASRRVAEKIGMHLDGQLTRNRQHYWMYTLAFAASGRPGDA